MDVKLYLIPDSAWCLKAKEWLKKKKVAFQEMDMSESDTYRGEVLEKTSQLCVPVIEIDGKMIIGFQEKELEEIFKK